MGFLPYMPIIIFLLFYVIYINIKYKKLHSIIWPCGIFLMMFLSEMTANWNHGCAGISRYNIWLIPIIIFYIINQINFNKKLLKGLLYISIVVQTIIIYYFGIFNCNINYLDFTPMCKSILNNVPSLYSPDPEIFVERTNHYEGNIDKGAIYIYNNSVRKVYANYYEFRNIENDYNIIDEKFFTEKLSQLEKNKDKMMYINIKKDAILKK